MVFESYTKETTKTFFPLMRKCKQGTHLGPLHSLKKKKKMKKKKDSRRVVTVVPRGSFYKVSVSLDIDWSGILHICMFAFFWLGPVYCL